MISIERWSSHAIIGYDDNDNDDDDRYINILISDSMITNKINLISDPRKRFKFEII